ncbi:MAG: sulfite exporter TauE/SafE family protein [Clostridia bacterium]|nr:sulfite exporter TauE/SafE family protein [Clostridia bacterium]
MKIKKKFKNWFLDAIWGSVIGFFNGFLGSGGGMIAVPILENLKKIENKKAHATAIAVIFPLSLISAIIYSINFEFEWLTVVVLSVGVTIGGVFGSIFLKKLNGKIIRIIFASLMLFAGVRMLFWV